ncbi:MAG TPA: phosphate ABC transporter substrate-binding protein [Nitrospirae bacterium]|nr:phosphate ABC transporter substrate-binding protein [Nitrospirota bacterium]
MKIFLVLAFIAVIAFAYAGEAAAAKEIVVAGSTTIQKRVLEPSHDAIEAATGIDLKVRGINSGRGFSELVAGKIVASVSSSPLTGLLEKAGLPDNGAYQEHIIIEDIIVPIVHKSNPVSKLTWQQLSDINTGKITNWKEVGGPDRKIIVVTSQPTAATRRVFQKKVMKKAPYIKGVREVKSTRQEVGLVLKFKGGIGAVSEGFVAMNPGKVKVVRTDRISRLSLII